MASGRACIAVQIRYGDEYRRCVYGFVRTDYGAGTKVRSDEYVAVVVLYAAAGCRAASRPGAAAAEQVDRRRSFQASGSLRPVFGMLFCLTERPSGFRLFFFLKYFSSWVYIH